MGEYKDFQIPEKEELLLGEFDDNQIRESKMKKVTNWERNGVFEKVKSYHESCSDGESKELLAVKRIDEIPNACVKVEGRESKQFRI